VNFVATLINRGFSTAMSASRWFDWDKRSQPMKKSRLIFLLSLTAFLATAVAARQIEPVRVDDSAQEKKLIKRVEPVYPDIARNIPVRGPVVLEVVVNEKGEVVEAKIVKGGNPVVQKPVYDAVKQWRYSPYYVDGKPVPVKFRVTVIVKTSAIATYRRSPA
jgi:TonB family protein